MRNYFAEQLKSQAVPLANAFPQLTAPLFLELVPEGLPLNTGDSVEIDVSSQYDMLSSRRDSSDTMLWEAPTISLTAQAFLLNIGLDSDDCAAIIVASLLGFTASLAAIHLMMKHRFFEQRDSILLEKMEKKYATHLFNCEPPKVIGSSYKRWLFALAAFGEGAAIAGCRAVFQIPDAKIDWPGKVGLCVLICILGAAVLAYLIKSWDKEIEAAIGKIRESDLEPSPAATPAP